MHRFVGEKLDEVHKTLQGVVLTQNDMRLDVQNAVSAAREAKEHAAEAAAQGKITNGNVKALELWRAMMEGGGHVLTVQLGMLFGSGILVVVGLFIASRVWP